MIEQIFEKRKYVRFRAKEGAFAVLGPDVDKLGQIIDISINGLSLTYIANGGQSGEILELDILLANEGFYLDKIPCRTVSDFEMPLNKRIPFASIIMRRCSVNFGELNDKQMSRLKYFIENHTIKSTFT